MNNDRFQIKTISNRFLYECFLKTIAFERTIVYEKTLLLTIMLTIVNEGSSLTIVNEMPYFIKTIVFEKKIHATLLKLNSCVGAKTS